MFYYKTKKDLVFFNNSINIPHKLPVNACQYKPCINDGTCVTTPRNESHCKCGQLWTGIFCHLTLCTRKPCGDHGVCELNQESFAGYVCHCDSGYMGTHCENTISPCTKGNPCGDRGSCSLINGLTKCKCHPWYEGVHCERFAFKIQYKPLSKKMLEEPFWLGLICVAAVLAMLSIVYCIKKKFSERIEAFFAEEIEKSKSTYSIPRYSLTSNVGVNLNISPVNVSPLPRSRSTFMTRLRKHKIRRNSNINHYSDSETVNMDQYSDAESVGAYHPTPSYMRHASSARNSVYDLNDEKRQILQSLVGSGNSVKNRRLSLDEFIQSNRRLKMHKLMQRTIDQSASDVSLSDGESSFISSAKSPSSSPGHRSPVNLLRQFSAISEASQEDQCSRVVSRNNTLPGDSSTESLNFLTHSPIMKQESETELLINGIQSIQRVSQNNLYSIDMDNPQPSTSGYNSKPEKFISSTSSTSSGASTPNHFIPPSIMITTDAAIEHHNRGVDEEQLGHRTPIHSPKKSRTSFSSMLSELIVPVQTIRRLSEPSANPSEDGMRSISPGSQSCGAPIIKKSLESTKCRKFSLEMVPKIQINTDKVGGDPNMTPNPCMKAMHYLNPMAINASSDRTISESNLSTSGYSSFSSPGISRCNSSSPFPEEIGGVNAELTTIVIPDVPQMEFKHKQSHEIRTNYGNYLSIPIFTFPNKEGSEKSRHRPKTPTSCNSIMICPEIKISPAELDQMTDSIANNIVVDEGIDVDIDFARESKESLKFNKDFTSIEMQSRPANFLDVKRKKKTLPSPTHSLEEFTIEPVRKVERLKTPKIRRNPSWPAVAPTSPISSSSSDFEDKSKANKTNKKQYLTAKVKRFHKRRLRTRSRSQAESSFSVNSAMADNCLMSSSKSGTKWFQPSSRSSSTESFLSTNEDENTVITKLDSKRRNISSQSLFEPTCDIFNTTSDSDSLAQAHQKQAIACVSDSFLNQTNISTNSLDLNHLSAPSSSFESRRRSRRGIQKQKNMNEDDIDLSSIDKQMLLNQI